MGVERIIWNKLGIQRGDTLPFTGGSDRQPWNFTATRVTLAEIMAEAGYKVGAEIGVERGVYSQVLCQKIPGLKLYCVDPWQPYGISDARRERSAFRSAQAVLAGFNVEFVIKTSWEASKIIPDRSLDFVYIDAMHDFDNVMTDLILWVPKVKVGGIVSGHDYAPYWQFGVIQAVNTYTKAHNILNWYLVMGDREPSWLWVNK